MKTRATRTAIAAGVGERERAIGGSRMRETEAKAVAQHVHGIRLGVPARG
jgi:hypothetical protein